MPKRIRFKKTLRDSTERQRVVWDWQRQIDGIQKHVTAKLTALHLPGPQEGVLWEIHPLEEALWSIAQLRGAESKTDVVLHTLHLADALWRANAAPFLADAIRARKRSEATAKGNRGRAKLTRDQAFQEAALLRAQPPKAGEVWNTTTIVDSLAKSLSQ